MKESKGITGFGGGLSREFIDGNYGLRIEKDHEVWIYPTYIGEDTILEKAGL